jgi:PEP-CTERM motif
MNKYLLIITTVLFSTKLAIAQDWTFTTIPSSGNLQGSSLERVGWGYSITNNQSNWLWVTTVEVPQPPELTVGFFDNTIFKNQLALLSPNTTLTINYQKGNTGLVEFLIKQSPTTGQMDSGKIGIQGYWYDDDPFNGGNFIGEAGTLYSPFSVTVLGSTSTPEPSTYLLLGLGAIVGLSYIYVRRRRVLNTIQRC